MNKKWFMIGLTSSLVYLMTMLYIGSERLGQITDRIDRYVVLYVLSFIVVYTITLWFEYIVETIRGK